MEQVPDNPNRECNNCGNRDWKKVNERTPTDYPDGSDITRVLYVCTECGGEGRLYTGGSTPRYSANLR